MLLQNNVSLNNRNLALQIGRSSSLGIVKFSFFLSRFVLVAQMTDPVISFALSKIGFTVLEENFKKEKIEATMVSALTDSELTRLGLTTIGTRHQFKKAVSEQMNTSNHSNRSLRDEIRQERSLLFQNTIGGRSGSKKQCVRTWTMQFLCLSDRNQQKAPSPVEKEILNKAGLGFKKIQLSIFFLYAF